MTRYDLLSYTAVLGIAALSLQSCSKDEDPVDAMENPIASNGDDPAELVAARVLYQDYYEGSRLSNNDIAWSGGDISQCVMGSVPNGTLEKIMQRLTYYRKAVGLENDVTVSSSKSEKAQAAALMMDANNRLDHFPSTDWSCYTEDGRDGAGNSLLSTAHGPSAIDSYMRDAGSSNGHVGHRRWLLYPRLGEVGIGNTPGANAFWVLGNQITRPDDAPEFIAWPTQGYTPNNLVFDRWSFSVAGADFSDATVSMRTENGDATAVQLEAIDNQFGDRTIAWVPENINTTVVDGVGATYSVTVSNVMVSGESLSFTYNVTLFDPNP